jgi:4-diphosphocytidyl-2-C-methyl-D-erythritol kinase
MIVFPNCKINLGLHVMRKRTDGYHELETIFYPVSLHDMLEITEYRQPTRSHTIPFETSGMAIEGDPSSNLCLKAYRLLKRDYPELPHIQMHLHKVIPSGAGLGGGSSDAAFTLQLLNQLFKLGLFAPQLIEYAAELGSDCAFFIINKPCYAKGKGEYLEEIELDLSPYKFVIINPGIHIHTGRAFLDMRPEIPEKSLKEAIQAPVIKWKDELKNDFEVPIFKKHREIVEIKDELYRLGAVYASMSGSGSTVYGMFPKDKQTSFAFPEHYFVRELLN